MFQCESRYAIRPDPCIMLSFTNAELVLESDGSIGGIFDCSHSQIVIYQRIFMKILKKCIYVYFILYIFFIFSQRVNLVFYSMDFKCKRAIVSSDGPLSVFLAHKCSLSEYPNARVCYQRVLICHCEGSPRIFAICTVVDCRL